MKRSKALRRFYAQLIVANARLPASSSMLMDAFFTVKRENFVGPGPWNVFTPMGYITTPSDHTEHLYQDILVALNRVKMINNGQPSLHAASLAALNIQSGDNIVHVGAGTGYYTAILSTLTGNGGLVNAYEIEESIMESAINNLADYTNTTVHGTSGVDTHLPPSDAIYVSAGATHPPLSWLDALLPDGRLVFPLTSTQGAGCMILIRKKNDELFSFDFICPAQFISCIGARDSSLANRLDSAFSEGNLNDVKSLRRQSEPDATCRFATGHWWLSTEPVTSKVASDDES